MAVTVSWNGYGRVNNGDSLTGWSALKISGTGGGPSPAAADGALEGSGAVTCVVNKQRVALYYDLGAGNELDFSVSGTEENQMIFIWAQFLAGSLLQVQSSGGFGIFLCSGTPSTTDYHLFYHYGSDNYDGKWVRLAIDPTSTVSSSSGTLDLSSIRYIGVFGDVGGSTARFDNLVCDAIDVGYGLKITGTATSDDWIGDMLTNEETNRYGGIVSKNDSNTAYGLGTQLLIGDNTGSLATTITDVDKKIFLEEPKYYDGTSVTNAVPLDFFKIEIVGNGTGATNVDWGKKVGTGDTAQGRNGLSFVGNSTYNLSIDFDDGNVNNCKIYGSTLEGVSGPISWGTNTSHEFIGNTVNGCEQFDPAGGVIIRNCNFTNYTGTDGALLWNENIDIKNCNFINNNRSIENPSSAGTPYSHDSLIMSGNTTDVNNTSGSAITINLTNGSNGSTSTGSGVTFSSSVLLSLVVKDSANNPISGANAYIDDNNQTPFILNSSTNASGIASTTWTGGSVVGATWRVRKYGYKPYTQIINIGTENKEQAVTLVVDPQQT